jgi:D-sedoheptulose 7-phosphate isomerase
MMPMSYAGELIRRRISENAEIARAILGSEDRLAVIERAADAVVECYRKGGKLFFMGNGGSAADAQHLATELVSRFYLERRALSAEALTVNSSILTGIGNDYDFEKVFSRQLEASARPGDVAFGISTSGNSRNIVAAMEAARGIGAVTVGFTGENGGLLAERSDICLRVPSSDTPRIQEAHILAGHIICEIVEKRLFA